MSAPHAKREEQFKSGSNSAQDIQRGVQQERDRFVGRLRGLTRDRDQVPSSEITALIEEVSSMSARESVADLMTGDPEFTALVGRVAAALDAYQRYVPNSHVTAHMDNDDDRAEFIIANLDCWLVVAVERDRRNIQVTVRRDGHIPKQEAGTNVVPWDGEDEPWVQLLRRRIDWLRSP